MRVLMLSLDKTLLGEQAQKIYGIQGDAIERHIKYGELVDKLNILVTSPPGFEHISLSGKVDVYPSNSSTKKGHLQAALELAEDIIEHSGLDLVVAQDLTAPAAWQIKRKLRVPYIVTFHGADLMSPEWQQGLKSKMLLFFVKKAIKQASGLRVVAQPIKKYFEKLDVKCPIAVIPTPSNVSIFAQPAEAVPNEMAKFPEHRWLLTDGRLEPVKNYPVLFEALSLLKEKGYKLKLFIIGTGSQKAALQALVKDMKLSREIVWLESLPYRQLPAFYQSAQIFILASQSESLGKVLIQAGAAGLPAVATRTLGAKSILLNGKTGYLVDIGEVDELAGKVIQLLDDEALRKKMGQASQKHILSNFKSSENIERFVEFWKKVAKNRI